MRATAHRMRSATEMDIVCIEQDSTGANAEKGRFSVEVTDTAAIVVIMRLWLAGAAVEHIATAMQLGLLPPKSK